MINSQKGFSASNLMVIAIIVVLVIVSGYYFYSNKRMFGTPVVENNTQSMNLASTTSLQVQSESVVGDNLISYTHSVFGIKFEFPKFIKSIKTNLIGKYFGPETEVTELKAIELLSESGTGAGWNAELLNNCGDDTTLPYCFGIEVGIWPETIDARYSNEISSMSINGNKVYLITDQYEPVYDTLEGIGSPTHYMSYSIVNDSRNLVFRVSFLTAKKQMGSLSRADIKAENDLFNYIKDNIVPDIIKSVQHTGDRKFEPRTSYSVN